MKRSRFWIVVAGTALLAAGLTRLLARDLVRPPEILAPSEIQRIAPNKAHPPAAPEGAASLEDAAAVTIVFVGDVGLPGAVLSRVSASLVRTCKELGCDLGLVLGDLLYTDVPVPPTSTLYDAAWFAPYEGLRSRPGFAFWAVLGNHDSAAGIAYEMERAAQDSFWNIPALDFDVPGLPPWLLIRGIYTPSLFSDDQPYWQGESADLVDHARGDVRRLAAAEESLCAPGHTGWKILFGHHPVYSSSHGRAERLEAELLPVIERCGVQLYLSGHVHRQEHVHTDTFDQLVQGAAADPRETRVWFTPGPRGTFDSGRAGYGVLRLTPKEALVNYFDADGVAIYSFARGVD